MECGIKAAQLAGVFEMKKTEKMAFALLLLAGSSAVAKTQIVSCRESAKSPLNRSAELVVPQRDGKASEAFLTVKDDDGEVIGLSKAPTTDELVDVQFDVTYSEKSLWEQKGQKISLTIPFSEAETFEGRLEIESVPSGQYDGTALMDCTARYY